jgi:hypothetical protein
MAMLRDPQEYESKADDLDLVLAGKEWTGLQRAYIDPNYDDYVLMSPSAVQAFLAAWLYRGIDDLGGSNHIRSGLLSHLNRVGDDLRYESGWARGLALLTRDQAQAVQALIRFIAAAASIKEHLLEGPTCISKTAESVSRRGPFLTGAGISETPLSRHPKCRRARVFRARVEVPAGIYGNSLVRVGNLPKPDFAGLCLNA